MAAVFTCGKCGWLVGKTATVCPHCGTSLAGIKCQSCGFVGSANDFFDDRCPKCHATIRIPAKETPRHIVCPVCGTPQPTFRKPKGWRQFLWGGWTCASCGAEMDRSGKKIGAPPRDSTGIE